MDDVLSKARARKRVLGSGAIGRSALALATLTLLLGGCATLENKWLVGVPRTLGPWERVYPDRLLAGLDGPDVPAVLGVRQRQSPGEETIQVASLANATASEGENRLIVALTQVGGQRPSPAIAETGGDYAFPPRLVERNATRLFPGARLSSEPETRRNGLGPYQYLTADYPGEARCIYAWQVLRPQQAGTLPAGARAMALQLRYCERGAELARLLAIGDSLRLRFPAAAVADLGGGKGA